MNGMNDFRVDEFFFQLFLAIIATDTAFVDYHIFWTR